MDIRKSKIGYGILCVAALAVVFGGFYILRVTSTQKTPPGVAQYDETRKPIVPASVARFQEAAENGNVRAQYALAQIYHYGDGVPKDPEKAFRWYEEAAKNGDIDAMLFTAHYYRGIFAGSTMEKNLDEAEKWFRQAAEMGDKRGMRYLSSVLYERLRNGETDREAEAREWYDRGTEGMEHFHHHEDDGHAHEGSFHGGQPIPDVIGQTPIPQPQDDTITEPHDHDHNHEDGHNGVQE